MKAKYNRVERNFFFQHNPLEAQCLWFNVPLSLRSPSQSAFLQGLQNKCSQRWSPRLFEIFFPSESGTSPREPNQADILEVEEFRTSVPLDFVERRHLSGRERSWITSHFICIFLGAFLESRVLVCPGLVRGIGQQQSPHLQDNQSAKSLASQKTDATFPGE